MCGINGFNFRDRDLIAKMIRKTKHRGPDDNGSYMNNSLSFGHVRLSIQDLTAKGRQPFNYLVKDREYIIIFNGEIFNFKEIREDLIEQGYKFKSDSDTEVILAAYHKWGHDCVTKFNGMWAFCIYDKKNQELFLSRDRFGKKPLYYYMHDSKFIFSSEIKAILVHDIKKEIDKDSVNEIFTYRFAFDDKTIFKGIYDFKPGHNMLFDLKTNKLRKYECYYDVNKILSKSKSLSFEDAKKELYNLLDKSVKYRMVSDVPVAALLSGGLDSSIVTYLASKHNKNLNTFSIGFDTTNELNYAKDVANFLKTNHTEIIIDKDHVVDYLYDMVYHMDEPIGADPGFFPFYILSKEVSKKNKVVLSGDGADEIFVGYDRYKMFYYGRTLSKFVPKFLGIDHPIFDRLMAMKNKDNFEAFIEITRVFEDYELEKMNLKSKVNRKVWNNINATGLKQVQIFDIKTLLPKDFFMKADKMSSAFGLEQRAPFMDYKLVEFGLSLPNKYKLKGWNEKYILKETFKDYLPKSISKRRKHGFNVPIDYWFENVLGDKLFQLIKRDNHDLYDKEYVLELLERLKKSNTGFKARNIIAQKLWSVLIFEIWYEIYILNKR